MSNKRSGMHALGKDRWQLNASVAAEQDKEANERSELIDHNDTSEPQLRSGRSERLEGADGESMELLHVAALDADDLQDDEHGQLIGTRRSRACVEIARACKMHTNQPSPESRADDAPTPQPNTLKLSPNSDERVAQMTEQRKNSYNQACIVTPAASPKPQAKLANTPKPTTTTTVTTDGIKGALSGTAKGDKRRESSNSSVTNGHAATSSGDRGGGGGVSCNDDDETDVIGDLMGHFGKWQFLMTILLSLFQVPNTFHISSSIYQAANKNFWCVRPAHLQHLPVDVWRNMSNSQDNCFQSPIDWTQVSNATAPLKTLANRQALPQTLTTTTTGDGDGGGGDGSARGLNTTRIVCTAWEYETNDNVGNTWTSEWNLVCDQEYLKNVAEMFFLLGVATGGIISGYLSDRFGRKKMLFISAVLQTIFGLALYFPNSFEMYLTLRALLGLVSVSVTYAGLILAIEYVDGKWRTIAGMYNLFPLPISYMLISGIAYQTQDYQRLQLVIGLPGIFLCFLWFVVPESPRWLLVKGRVAEVKRIVEAAAKFNGRQLPANYESMLKPPTQEASSQDILCLFRTAYLRRVTVCFASIWFTMNLVYYGIILNMSSFGGNVYLNSALAGLVEIPAIAIAMYIITKVGKKYLFCATLMCAGMACCCAAITEGEDDLLWLKITFLMIGKFTISAGNTIMPVYTAELYPTAIRNVGVGACNMAAGLALILTPYLSLLNKIEGHILMALLTAGSIFGGVVVLFLPETNMAHARKNPPVAKDVRCHRKNVHQNVTSSLKG